MTDTRPNGYVKWQTTTTEEYECVFSPECMEALGFAFIDWQWTRDYDSERDPADELAEEEGSYGDLITCEREVTYLTNTDSVPDSDSEE